MTNLAKDSWGVENRLPDLDDMDAKKWMDLVERRTGVMITLDRKSFLMTGLRARIHEVGLKDYNSYFQLLAGNDGWSPEWSGLIHRLTVHETSFFRHAPSLMLLEKLVLPEYLERNHDNHAAFQVWSLGCSSGEEPYTLAMLIHKYMSEAGIERAFDVTATDISEDSLAEAKKGIYSARRIAGVPVDLRTRYCEVLADGAFEVARELRRRVRFAQLNVMDLSAFSLDRLDLVYCQNMLIYFSRDCRQRILSLLAERIAPGGVLVLGPGDVPNWTHPDYERIRFEGTLAFRRRASSAMSV